MMNSPLYGSSRLGATVIYTFTGCGIIVLFFDHVLISWFSQSMINFDISIFLLPVVMLSFTWKSIISILFWLPQLWSNTRFLVSFALVCIFISKPYLENHSHALYFLQCKLSCELPFLEILLYLQLQLQSMDANNPESIVLFFLWQAEFRGVFWLRFSLCTLFQQSFVPLHDLILPDGTSQRSGWK